MFNFTRTRSSSGSSTSSNSSLSLSPTGWSPSRPTVSPPTMTTTPFTTTTSPSDYFSFTPFRSTSSTVSRRSSSLSPPAHSFSDTHLHHACAYPSWPVRASLSTSYTDLNVPASPSAYHPTYQPASSRISDADLEDLDFDAPGIDMGALSEGMGLGISWSAVGNANTIVEKPETRRRLPPPPTEMRMTTTSSKRRRSSSRGTKRKVQVKLGAIAE